MKSVTGCLPSSNGCGDRTVAPASSHTGCVLTSTLAMTEKKGWGNTVLGWFIVNENDPQNQAGLDGGMLLPDSIVDAVDARSTILPPLPRSPPRSSRTPRSPLSPSRLTVVGRKKSQNLKELIMRK